jgi:hypothetical protein
MGMKEYKMRVVLTVKRLLDCPVAEGKRSFVASAHARPHASRCAISSPDVQPALPCRIYVKLKWGSRYMWGQREVSGSTIGHACLHTRVRCSPAPTRPCPCSDVGPFFEVCPFL